MSLIICATGPIDSGKSEFCTFLRTHESSSIGFESGQLIVEVANEFNVYLDSESKKFIEGNDFLDTINAALTKLEQNHPDLLGGEQGRITFSANDLLEHPEQFERLEQYLAIVRQQPAILTQRITPENKDQYYRPLLQWIGGYMVYKISPTVWFDEIGRRILRFQPLPELITVNALRYPTDEQTMRSFAQANELSCLVLEVQRPGMNEGTDVTETSRSNIQSDSVILNNGSIEELSKIARSVLHDARHDKLKPRYQSHRSFFSFK